MRLLKIITLSICALLVAWCEINLSFKSDEDVIWKAVEKVAYLYNNCMFDLEWLEEVMTPEAWESMDETCKASIKTMKKLKSTVEKIRLKVGENPTIITILDRINTAIASLENGTSQVKSLYNQFQGDWSQIDFAQKYNEILNNMKNQNISETLSGIQAGLSNL